jgi:GTP pyrophosphokinase
MEETPAQGCDPAAILAEYDAHHDLYDGFRNACDTLLNQLLKAEQFSVHSVTSRLKSRTSLQRKLERAGKEYRSLSEVTDVAGIRVITHFEDEVDRMGSLIEREFAVDPTRSIDKRKLLDPDRFGYLSLHYICGVRVDRGALSEYQPYKTLVCEIQIRSILQHAWAEIEHDLGYRHKVASTIPVPVRRRFSRLAGLLEIADREFTQIRDELVAYASRVRREIATAPSSVTIDIISLDVFIESDEVLRGLDAAMANHIGAKLYKSTDIAILVDQLRYAGLLTIEDVRLALRSHKQIILRQWKERVDKNQRKRDQLMEGISLFQLFQVVIAEKGSAAELYSAFNKFEIGEPQLRRQIAESIVGTIQKI